MNEPVYKTKTRLILYFLKGAKRYVLLSACFAALVSLLDMLSPRLISFTVDYVVGDAQPPLNAVTGKLVSLAGGMELLRAHPVRIALAAALLGVTAAVCRYLFRLFNAKGAQAFTERMRNKLFTHILHLPFSWLNENSTGDIIQRCTSDVQTIKRFVSEQLTALVRTLLLIALALYFMSRIHAGLMLVNLIFIPVVVGYSLFFYRQFARSFLKADVEEGVLSAIAQENLTGVRVVRAFGRELYERKRFEQQNRTYTGFWIDLFRLMSVYWAFGDVLTALQTMTTVALGAWLCILHQMSAGGYIAFISYTIMLAWPVRSLGRVISEMSKAGVSIGRLQDIMNAVPEQDCAGAAPAPMDGDIVFDHVSFSYEKGGAKALDDVSFTIPGGSVFGILGGTGSGKSTLLYLLERLYTLPEDNGRITISGKDIAGMPLDWVRRNIGIVLQEPYLFSRTLKENIGLAADTAGEEEIRRAAAIACIDEAIETFTDGYETMVGERGVTLSGGQKQRTAIAQMLIRRPPVMIFDDSLSAVDANTDSRIRKALAAGTGSSTVILVAHRITTLMHADCILVMDRGRVREMGTHRELLEKGGLYSRIYNLQTAGLEVPEDEDE